jgi:hypothetical protein
MKLYHHIMEMEQMVVERLLAEIRANQAKMEPAKNSERRNAGQDGNLPRKDGSPSRKDDGQDGLPAREMEACLDKTEAAMETIKAMEGRYGDSHHGDGGSQKMLAAACKGMTHRAIPAPSKGHGCQGPDRDSVAAGGPKRGTLGKRHRVQPECNKK